MLSKDLYLFPLDWMSTTNLGRKKQRSTTQWIPTTLHSTFWHNQHPGRCIPQGRRQNCSGTEWRGFHFDITWSGIKVLPACVVQWLREDEIFCHDLEVMGLNPGQGGIGVCNVWSLWPIQTNHKEKAYVAVLPRLILLYWQKKYV